MSEISQKQMEANRENAKLGGVKTKEGKAVSKYNALKHGLLSEKALIKEESRNDLDELGKKIRDDLKPLSELERLLTDKIVADFWRLRRALGAEHGLMYSDFGGMSRHADTFLRYEAMLERGIFKALHELQRLQATRNGERPPAPVAIDIDILKE